MVTNNLKKIVLDIETVGFDYDSFDDYTKLQIVKLLRAEIPEKGGEPQINGKSIKEFLGLTPLTGQVVVCGVLDINANKGTVYYQNLNPRAVKTTEGIFTFVPLSEKGILESFWELAENYQEFITFNGRQFDIPFLMIRSAIHGIRPTKDLLNNRYLSGQRWDSKHIDLQELLTFYGAPSFKGSIHMWCKAFGIESPKENETSGDMVGKMFAEGKFLEIANYNKGDVIATKKLYEIWDSKLRF
jgi:DNA polymerase elongation subunit (family B)